MQEKKVYSPKKIIFLTLGTLSMLFGLFFVELGIYSYFSNGDMRTSGTLIDATIIGQEIKNVKERRGTKKKHFVVNTHIFIPKIHYNCQGKEFEGYNDTFLSKQPYSTGSTLKMYCKLNGDKIDIQKTEIVGTNFGTILLIITGISFIFIGFFTYRIIA